MPREDGEVDAEGLHVDGAVQHGLRGVEEDDGALRVRPAHELGDGRAHAEGVRLVREGDDAHAPRAGDPVEPVELQVALVVDVEEAELGARLLGEHLPGHEVRVVLEHRRDDHVAGAAGRAAVGLGDEVDRLRRVAREHDLPRRGRVEEARDGAARRLEGLGALHAERVDAAVDVRVRGGVEAGQRVEHRLRLLRRGGGVEVGERAPVDLAGEDREVGADRVDVEHGCGVPRGHRVRAV